MTNTFVDQSGKTRHAKGAPASIGGQYAPARNAAQATTLDRPQKWNELVEARRNELASRGYQIAQPGYRRAHSKSGEAKAWWEEMQARAEVRPDGHAVYPKMIGEHTQRRARYQVAGLDVRMPSRRMVDVFSKVHGHETFEIPVEVSAPSGKSVMMWVRTTRHGAGNWTVTPVGAAEAGLEQADVARSVAAVTAVLETSRPNTLPIEYPTPQSLRQAYVDRHVGRGALMEKIDETRSDWVRGFAWNPNAGEMVIDLQGRQYGYEVDENVIHHIRTTTSVGRVYNHLVKNVAPRFEVAQCPHCDRWHRAQRKHACPTGHKERVVQNDPYTEMVRRRAGL